MAKFANHAEYRKNFRKPKAKGSERNREKPKSIAAVAAKGEARYLLEGQKRYQELLAAGRATRRKPSGTYYILGD